VGIEELAGTISGDHRRECPGSRLHSWSANFFRIQVYHLSEPNATLYVLITQSLTPSRFDGFYFFRPDATGFLE
jgi:hypothetical protein